MTPITNRRRKSRSGLSHESSADTENKQVMEHYKWVFSISTVSLTKNQIEKSIQDNTKERED